MSDDEPNVDEMNDADRLINTLGDIGEELKRIANSLERVTKLMTANALPDYRFVELLEFVADRLVHIYHENPNVDFVLALRRRASELRKSGH